MSRESYKELPNCKIGVTNTVHQRLRELKQKGDNFNDVVERLLDGTEKPSEEKFDIVEVLAEAESKSFMCTDSMLTCGCSQCKLNFGIN